MNYTVLILLVIGVLSIAKRTESQKLSERYGQKTLSLDYIFERDELERENRQKRRG